MSTEDLQQDVSQFSKAGERAVADAEATAASIGSGRKVRVEHRSRESINV